MPLLKRIHSADRDVEKRILIGLIISDKVLNKLIPFLKPNILELSVSQEITKWLIDYHTKYKQAPKAHIKDLFLIAKQKLPPAIAEEVELFLAKLSEEYINESGGIEGGINEDFIIDRGLQYLRERHLRKMIEEVSALIETGEVEKAEQLAEKRRKVIEETEYRWVSPLDDFKYMSEVFEEREEPLWTLKGGLGELVGPLYRGWLVGVMGPRKRGKCISEDSTVLLSNGEVKTIREVVENKIENIITFDPNSNNFLPCKISNYYNNGIKSVFLVKTRSGREIEVSDVHPFLCGFYHQARPKWKQLRELKVGDYIGVPKLTPFFGKNKMEKYKVRLLAYLLADGGLTSGITFTKKEKEIQDDFKYCVKQMGDNFTQEKWDQITFRITNKNKIPGIKSNTRIWLLSLGITNEKSSEKTIPKEIFSLPKEDLRIFLSTLFTCDGWIINKEIGYSTANEIFIHQITHLLIRFGIVGIITKKIINAIPYYSITLRDKENMIKFMNEIGFTFSKLKKMNKLRDHIEKRTAGKGFLDIFPPEFSRQIRNCIINKKTREWWNQKPLSNLGQSTRIQSNLTRSTVQKLSRIIKHPYPDYLSKLPIFWDRIVEIKYAGKKQTYDLTIEKTHNFVANDFIVHNTWSLQDLAFDGVLSKRRVVYASLEMMDKHQSTRLYSQVGRMGKIEKEYKIPCFDCCANQDNSCNKRTRVCSEEKPERFEPNQTYKSCTICRKVKKEEDDFSVTTWWEMEKRPALSRKGTKKELTKLQKMIGHHLFKLISYPSYSASLSDLENDLERLEIKEGFIPDIILVDYDEALIPETNYHEYRHQIGGIWKRAKQIAETRSCLVIMASQSNRGSEEREILSVRDTSEDISKLNHVDIMITLNQTEQEKERGVWRIGLLEHRWKEFSKRRQLLALQSFELGQPILDGEIIYYEYQRD